MKLSSFSFLCLWFFTFNSLSAQISTQTYIDTYKDLAIAEMQRTGIPASITLAQGILESANGNSMLAKKANNHFGIKCHSTWTGKTIHKDDDAKNECFRKYPNAYDSFKDHSDFLTKGQRYAFLFEYPSTDYKKWAKGLKKAGYATSNTYASRLIEIIEKYQLDQYDDPKASRLVQNDKYQSTEPKKTSHRKPKLTKEDYAVQLGRKILLNNNVKFIMAKKGDSYPKIIDEFQMLRWELYKYNDVDNGDALKTGTKVYIQPKRNKAERGKNTHTVKNGETLYSISQDYAIKLRKLAKRNDLSPDSDVKEGDILKLR